MSTHKVSRALILIFAAALVSSACGGDSATAAPGPTAAPTEAQAAARPTEVNIAAIFSSSVEQPWVTSWLQTMERLDAEKLHGLTITVTYTESVAAPDAERVLNEYAKSGDYQIIWAHSAYGEAVQALHQRYPAIVWAMSGSGNLGLGGNAFWADVFIHEPAYVSGIIAGMMTQSDSIGAVAAFPFPNVNIPLNAFIAGARSVNPNVKARVAYIESWFDPPKAKESAEGQIAAGADFIYAERFGPFEAVQAHPGVYAIGHFMDQNSLAPEVVVTSSVAKWDPTARYIIDAWWNYAVNGAPLNAPTERIWFGLKDGGSELAPYYGLESAIPQGVKDAAQQAQADIRAGTLEISMNEEPITSD